MKFLFEYLTNSFSLLNNPLNNYIVMAVIGIIAYRIAYTLVGDLYCLDLIDGRGTGHVLHWIIRLIVFVVIFYGVATTIRVYKWFYGLPDYKWSIMGSVAIGIIMIAVLIKHLFAKRLKK